MELKKNPESVLAAAVDGAKTSSLIETMRAKGASDQEVVAAVFGDRDEMLDFAKEMWILLNLGLLGHYFGYTKLNNPSTLGYAYLIQHYTEALEALEYQSFYDKAKTNKDIYNFFCSKTEIDPDKVKTFEGYDDVWFNKWLNLDFEKGGSFGISEEHSKKLLQAYNEQSKNEP